MSMDLRLVVKQLNDDLVKLTAERDALAEEITETRRLLEKTVEERKDVERQRDALAAAVVEEQRLCALKCKSLASLVACMRDACSEPIGDDPRMHYVEVQIDRGDWDGLFRPQDMKGAADAK